MHDDLFEWLFEWEPSSRRWWQRHRRRHAKSRPLNPYLIRTWVVAVAAACLVAGSHVVPVRASQRPAVVSALGAYWAATTSTTTTPAASVGDAPSDGVPSGEALSTEVPSDGVRSDASTPDQPSGPRTWDGPWVAPVGSIMVVGDSLAVGAGSQLASMMDQVSVDARVGAGVVEVHGKAQRALASGPAGMWVEAGINSVNPSNPSNPGLRDKLAALMDLVAPVGCVVWPTYPERVYGNSGWMAATSNLNATLWELAASRPWMRIVDFAGAVRQDASLVAGDGLHLTGSGNWVLAQMVHDALGSCRAG